MIVGVSFGMIGGLRLMLIGFVVAAVSLGFGSLVGDWFALRCLV